MSAIIFRLPLLDGSTEEVPIAGFIRHDEYVTAFRDTPEGHSAMLAFSMVPRDLRAIMLDEVTAAIADDPLANFSPDGGLARGTLLLECPRALMAAPLYALVGVSPDVCDGDAPYLDPHAVAAAIAADPSAEYI
jgi:hypothetical protein